MKALSAVRSKLLGSVESGARTAGLNVPGATASDEELTTDVAEPFLWRTCHQTQQKTPAISSVH